MTQKTSDVRVVGIKATTIGMVQGTFLALIGLVSAIAFTASATMNATKETESLLSGLTLGLASGIISIIFVPIIYFIVGWVLGLIQGLIINAIVRLSGGIVLRTTIDKE